MGNTWYPEQIRDDKDCEVGSIDFGEGKLMVDGVGLAAGGGIVGLTASAAELNLLDGAATDDAIADAKDDYDTGDLDAEAEIIAAVNATNATINSILAALRGFNVIAAD